LFIESHTKTEEQEKKNIYIRRNKQAVEKNGYNNNARWRQQLTKTKKKKINT